jgi:hypothetical protein
MLDEPGRCKTQMLQLAPFPVVKYVSWLDKDRRGWTLSWHLLKDSNPRRAGLEPAALTTELNRYWYRLLDLNQRISVHSGSLCL